MTNEELVILIQSGINTKDNMSLLYQQNRGFIWQVVSPYIKPLGSSAASWRSTTVMEKEDLMQEAYFGLVEAVERFDVAGEFKFLTYAGHWIKQKVYRYIENNGNIKRVPSHELQLMSKYQQFKNAVRNDTGQEPTEIEYIEYLCISKKQLRTLEKTIYEMTCRSIHELLPGMDDVTLADTLTDSFNLEDSVLDNVCAEQDRVILWEAIGEMDAEHRRIMESRYKANLDRQVIAERENISMSRVRQLEIEALQFLRRRKQIKDIGSIYSCKAAFRYGLQRFKDTGLSSTEFVALKSLGELDECSM